LILVRVAKVQKTTRRGERDRGLAGEIRPALARKRLGRLRQRRGPRQDDALAGGSRHRCFRNAWRVGPGRREKLSDVALRGPVVALGNGKSNLSKEEEQENLSVSETGTGTTERTSSS